MHADWLLRRQAAWGYVFDAKISISVSQPLELTRACYVTRRYTRNLWTVLGAGRVVLTPIKHLGGGGGGDMNNYLGAPGNHLHHPSGVLFC